MRKILLIVCLLVFCISLTSAWTEYEYEATNNCNSGGNPTCTINRISILETDQPTYNGITYIEVELWDRGSDFFGKTAGQDIDYDSLTGSKSVTFSGDGSGTGTVYWDCDKDPGGNWVDYCLFWAEIPAGLVINADCGVDERCLIDFSPGVSSSYLGYYTGDTATSVPQFGISSIICTGTGGGGGAKNDPYAYKTIVGIPFDCDVSVTDTKLLQYTDATGACNPNFTSANITITHVSSGLVYGYNTEGENDFIDETFYPNYAGDYNVTLWAEYDGDWYQFSDEFTFTEYGDQSPITVWYLDGTASGFKLFGKSVSCDIYYEESETVIYDGSTSTSRWDGYAFTSYDVCASGTQIGYEASTMCSEVWDDHTYFYVYMYPNSEPSNSSYVYAQFYVTNIYDSPISGATVSITGEGSCSTSYGGFCQIAVPENDTYDYTVSKTGYGTYWDSVEITDENEIINVTLIHEGAIPTPTPTPTPAGIPTTATPTPTQTGAGYISDTSRQAARESIASVADMAPMLLPIFLLLLLMSAMKKV